MLRSRGFTLIEVLLSLLILSILAAMTLGFVISSDSLGRNTTSFVNDNMNLRIGLEYLSREIREADSVRLIEKSGLYEIEVTSIEAQNASRNPKFYVYVDGEKIFLIDNILRRHTESQQLVSGIDSFSVSYLGEGLYTLRVCSERQSLSTRIYKRK